MKVNLAVAVALLFLILLAETQMVIPGAVAATPTPAQTPWWNNSYQLRRSITVVNGGSTPLVNQTVLVYLGFNGSDVEDPLSSLRLINASGSEIPSVIVGAQYSGIFLRSAYLLFSTTIPAASSQVYYAYFGSAFMSVPSYRASQPSNSIGSGFVTAGEQSVSLDSSRIQLGFGTADTETTMTKVSYTLGKAEDFGPSSFSQEPFSNDTGLILAGQLGSGSTVAYDSMQAGSVRLTRILILSPGTALTVDAVANDVSNTISGVNLTSVIGLSGLSASGTSTSTYSQSSRLLYTQNLDGYFVAAQSPIPVSYDIGVTSNLLSEASKETFSGTSSYTLASAAGFTWNLGDLQPESAKWVSSSWGVDTDISQLGAGLPASPVAAALGQLEVRNVATPKASSVWSANIILTDASIPASGLVLPFGIKGGTVLPGASSVTGTFVSTFPPSPQQNPRAWNAATSTSGNSTSFSSPEYYDFAASQDVARLLAYVPSTASSATASLTSLGGFSYGGANATLEVRYRAYSSTASGDLSAQNFFVAADFDPTLGNNYSESIFLPVAGSVTSSLPAGCASSGSQAAPPVQASVGGYLIGDGIWRTLTASLPSSLQGSGFNVRLRLCVSTSPGFAGTMDLEVASAGVVHRGSVSGILQSTFSDTVPELSLGYLPQAQSLSAAEVTTNLTVSLVFQTNATIGWADGSTFDGSVTPPSKFTLNNPVLVRTAIPISPSLDGVLVSSGVSRFAVTGKINGTAVSVSPNPGTAFLGAGKSFGSASALSFMVGLQSQTFLVQVLDQDQSGVQGAQVVPSVDGVNLPVTLITDSAGRVKMQLVPWAYQFNATYQGLYVGSAVAQVSSQSSVSLPSNIYRMTLVVRDNRGAPLSEAQITLTIGNLTLTGTTSNRGNYTFEAVANAIYGLAVGVGSGTYFSGQVGATANNAVIQVTTTYIPGSVELEIALLLAIIPIAIIAAYYVASRLRSPR